MHLSELFKSAGEPFTTDEGLELSKKVAKIPGEEFLKAGFSERRIAVLPGYSTQFLTKLLGLSLLREKIAGNILEFEYGVFESAIYGKNRRLKDFSPAILYFCVGTENSRFQSVEEEANRWLRLCETAHEWLGASILLNTFCEPVTKLPGRSHYQNVLNATLKERAPSFVRFLDIASLSSYYGRKNWQDEKMYDLYKLPCAYEYLTKYSEALAIACARFFGGAKKCIVLDLDNTLWGGVVGDDGVAAIHMGEGSPEGEAFKRFQEYLKTLKERGVILAVCSKNSEQIAREPFLRREEMVLKIEDFACFIANWDPKPKNIQQISKVLNIGLDSMVFIDDNPAERKLVKSELPEISVVDLPEDPAYFVRVLSEKNLFETENITDEDLKKTQMMREEATRIENRTRFSDYSDYLKSLKMVAQVHPFDELHLPRITQLINKTNQFNVTTKRYTESEISTMVADAGTVTRYVKLADQFGDYGLISAFIGKIEESELVINTWVMSCRVFQREVEYLLFQNIVNESVRRNLKAIRGVFIPTEKNGVIANLFMDLGFEALPKQKNEWFFSLKNKERKNWFTKLIPIELRA